MKKSIRITLFILLICLLTYSLFRIVGKSYSTYKDNKQYEQLREQVATIRSPGIPSKDPKEAAIEVPIVAPIVEIKPILKKLPYTIQEGDPNKLDKNGILKEYSSLYKENSNLVGWIQMPGFKEPIDYPVMQATDNDYYLNRDFNEKYSFAGSIFMDYRNNPQEDRNIVIYGHAMNDYSMFGNLMNFYAHSDKYTKRTQIYLNLMNKQMEYEIFSTYAVNQEYDYRQTDYANDNEYLDFLQRIQAKSVYNYNVKLTSDDKVLTLSTCNNEFGNEYRSVIHARLVKQINYRQEMLLNYSKGNDRIYD